MRTKLIHQPLRCFARAADPLLMLIVGIALVAFSRSQVTAETKGKQTVKLNPEIVNPFTPVVRRNATDPLDAFPSKAPVDVAAYASTESKAIAGQAVYQASAAEEATLPAQTDANAGGKTPKVTSNSKQPCAAANFKPLTQLGINIAQPTGQMPNDYATICWQQINAGPSAACRCWPMTCYQWDATCLCYRPLYFEEINAERYGYSCGLGRFGCCTNCLQSAVSAAHFFGTIPALPYCMSAYPPCECVYTLGYYRAGDCVPWRCNWPPCDPVAAVSAGGIYTGLIFAIP